MRSWLSIVLALGAAMTPAARIVMNLTVPSSPVSTGAPSSGFLANKEESPSLPINTPPALVNSFDVFDTLLARSVGHPTDVFRIVQRRLKLPDDFVSARQEAEALSCHEADSWDRLYRLLQQHYGWTDEYRDAVQLEEIQAEHDVAIPIAKNLARVKNGDLIVSDMYLPTSVIASLLKAVGLRVNYNLYVSVSGKHNGTAWRALLDAGWKIKRHLGDNYHSDVVMAQAAGIEAEHTTEWKPTAAEEMLLSDPQWTAHGQRLRRVRLENPYHLSAEEHAEAQAMIWEEQTRIYLPLCLYAARRIDERMQREGLSHVIVIDGFNSALKAVFDALYGFRKYSSAAIASSNATSALVGADVRFRNRMLLVDLHGTAGNRQQDYDRMFEDGADAPLRVTQLRYDDNLPPWPGLEAMFTSSTAPPQLRLFDLRTLEGRNQQHAKAAKRVLKKFVNGLPEAPFSGGHDDPQRSGAIALSPVLMRMVEEATYTTSVAMASQGMEQRNWDHRVLVLPSVTTIERGQALTSDGTVTTVHLVHDAWLNGGLLYMTGVPYDGIDPVLFWERGMRIDVISAEPRQPANLWESPTAVLLRTKEINENVTDGNYRVWTASWTHSAFINAKSITLRLEYRDNYFDGRILQDVTVHRSFRSKGGPLAVCALLSYDQGLLKLWIEWHALVGVSHFYLYYNGNEQSPELAHYVKTLKAALPDGVQVAFVPIPVHPLWIKLSTSLTKRRKHHHVQLAAYTSCLYRYYHRHDALMFIDVDELAVPMKTKTLTEMLEGLPYGWESVSMRMSWAKITSASFVEKLPDELSLPDVISEQRHILHLPSTDENWRIKSILNTRFSGEIERADSVPYLLTPHAPIPARNFTLAETEVVLLHLRNRRGGVSVEESDRDTMVEEHPFVMKDKRVASLVNALVARRREQLSSTSMSREDSCPLPGTV
jgi:Glycosyltransferase family 92